MRYFSSLLIAILSISMLLSSCTKWFGSSASGGMENDTTMSLVIREWSKRIVEYPENDEYRYKRGLELAKAKKFDLALADIEKAIEINGSNEDYYISRAEVYMGKNETKKALESYEKAAEINPKSEKALLELGRFYLFVRQFDKSEQTLLNLTKLNPANAEGHFYEGMLYKEKGDTTKAINQFGQAVQIDPYHYNSLIQLGQLYTQQLNPIGIPYFKNAILVDEFSDEAWYGMGYLYQQLGEYDSAIAKYQETININPAHYLAYYNTGFILFEQNNLEPAIEHFRIAVKFAPDYAKGHYMLGLCNEAKGNIEEANLHYERCLQVDPNFELAKLRMSRIKMK